MLTIAEKLDAAVQQVFESLLFLEAKPLDEGSELPGNILEANLSIKGKVGGTLALQVSIEDSMTLLQALPSTSNLPEREAIVDLFAELVNTVGGRLAAANAGTTEAFDLSIPSVRFERSAASSNEICRNFALEIGTVRFVFRPNHV